MEDRKNEQTKTSIPPSLDSKREEKNKFRNIARNRSSLQPIIQWYVSEY